MPIELVDRNWIEVTKKSYNSSSQMRLLGVTPHISNHHNDDKPVSATFSPTMSSVWLHWPLHHGRTMAAPWLSILCSHEARHDSYLLICRRKVQSVHTVCCRARPTPTQMWPQSHSRAAPRPSAPPSPTASCWTRSRWHQHQLGPTLH